MCVQSFIRALACFDLTSWSLERNLTSRLNPIILSVLLELDRSYTSAQLQVRGLEVLATDPWSDSIEVKNRPWGSFKTKEEMGFSSLQPIIDSDENYIR